MCKQIQIGLLGLGTVGSGVFKVLQDFETVNISKISVSNINKKRNIEGLDTSILTTDSFSIVNDPNIDVIVEVIGGIKPAYDLIKTAINNRKHVVTANKELVAKHGEELFELAKEKNVVILYEAAVAGGIPIIMPFKTALCANKITKIAGILNGTTNYILTKMDNEGAEFENVLKEAQDLGYAESDPTGDVQGYDAAYKVAILASIAFNKRVDENQIFREGIDKLAPIDFQHANEFGYKIKLIALANQCEEKYDVRVHPMLVSIEHPLSHINDVLNAVALEGKPVGQVMFSGPGAGEFPTASSVAGDVLALAYEMQFTDNPLPMMRCKHEEQVDLIDMEETVNKYYIRINAENYPGVIGDIGKICGDNNINLSSIVQKGTSAQTASIVILTEKAKEKDINTALENISALKSIRCVYNVIRVMD